MLLQDVTSLLRAVAPARAWYGQMPPEALMPGADGLVPPFVVWSRVAHTDEVDLDGATGLANVLLQVDIFGSRVAEAELLRLQIDAAFAAWRQKAVPVSLRDLFEEALSLAHIQREYSLWYQETTNVDAYQSTLYAPGLGRTFSGALASQWTHQLVVQAVSGAATAAGVVEGTNDPTGAAGWTPICTLDATDLAAGSPTPPVATHEWLLVRHRLTSLTGTGAWAQFNSTGA